MRGAGENNIQRPSLRKTASDGRRLQVSRDDDLQLRNELASGPAALQ